MRTQGTATPPCSQTSRQVRETSASAREHGLTTGCFPNPTLLLLTAPKPLLDQKKTQKEIAIASTQSPLRQRRHTNRRWPLRNQGQVSKAPRTCFNKSSASQSYRTSPSSTADISTHIPALCQTDSAIKQQKAVCGMPKQA